MPRRVIAHTASGDRLGRHIVIFKYDDGTTRKVQLGPNRQFMKVFPNPAWEEGNGQPKFIDHQDGVIARDANGRPRACWWDAT